MDTASRVSVFQYKSAASQLLLDVFSTWLMSATELLCLISLWVHSALPIALSLCGVFFFFAQWISGAALPTVLLFCLVFFVRPLISCAVLPTAFLFYCNFFFTLGISCVALSTSLLFSHTIWIFCYVCNTGTPHSWLFHFILCNIQAHITELDSSARTVDLYRGWGNPCNAWSNLHKVYNAQVCNIH